MTTINVELDESVAERLEQAANTQHQTPAAFLARAVTEAVHRALLDEAVGRFERDPDNVGLSELADDTGLAVEEIMEAVWRRDREAADAAGLAVAEVVGLRDRHKPEQADATFLAAAKSLADDRGDRRLLERAQALVAGKRGT